MRNGGFVVSVLPLLCDEQLQGQVIHKAVSLQPSLLARWGFFVVFS